MIQSMEYRCAAACRVFKLILAHPQLKNLWLKRWFTEGAFRSGWEVLRMRRWTRQTIYFCHRCLRVNTFQFIFFHTFMLYHVLVMRKVSNDFLYFGLLIRASSQDSMFLIECALKNLLSFVLSCLVSPLSNYDLHSASPIMWWFTLLKH